MISDDSEPLPAPKRGDFDERQRALRERVAAAADQLHGQGFRPTVARIRAALGGGSPNDLTPALKAWREAALGGSSVDNSVAPGASPLPPAIGDLAKELWQRACAAAALERRTGRAAVIAAGLSEDAEQLRAQVNALRDQLERESALYGELKLQAARHQSAGRHALEQLEASESRQRTQSRALGTANARIAELEAEVATLRSRNVRASPARHSRKRLSKARALKSPRSPSAVKHQPKRATRPKGRVSARKRR